MKELPKELTPELLSLVLDRKVLGIVPKENSIFIIFQQGNKDKDLNIDTLTRLMKEWCLEQGYSSRTININDDSDGGEGIYWIIEVLQFTEDAEYLKTVIDMYTEFEAVLKATNWVAREKGLIKC